MKNWMRNLYPLLIMMKMIYTLVTFGVTFPKATCAALCFSSGASLPTGVREPKEHEFFNILRRYKISLAFLQELGLNWYALIVSNGSAACAMN